MRLYCKVLLCALLVLLLAFANGWCAQKKSKKRIDTEIRKASPKPVAVASKITAVTIYPLNPAPGELFRVTAHGTPKLSKCKISILLGNGVSWALFANAKGFPYVDVNRYRYSQPGQYLLKIRGESTTDCNCSGMAELLINVKAPPKLTYFPNACPAGWKYKQINSETFTCVPKCPSNFKCPEGWVKECLDCGVRCNKAIAPPN
jgi:hypothetical protein